MSVQRRNLYADRNINGVHTMTIITSDIVAEWTFSTNSGSTVFDVSGNGNDLTITGANVSWVTEASGTGLRFSPKTHTSQAKLDDLLNNGTIGSSLGNASQWSFIIVTKLLDGDNFTFLAGVERNTTAGSPEFQFRQYTVTTQRMASVAMAHQGDITSVRDGTLAEYQNIVVTIQAIDTTQAVDADRHKYYRNGSLVASPDFPATTVQNSVLELVNRSDRSFSLGSNPTQTSSSQADIYYVAIINRQITDQEAFDVSTALLAANDSSIVSAPVPNPPVVGAAPQQIAVTDTSITVGSTATCTDPFTHTFGLWAPDARPVEVDGDNRLAAILAGDGALFFVNDISGTSGVEEQHVFNGLAPATTYVAYAAATNTVTGESARHTSGTWISTTPQQTVDSSGNHSKHCCR